MKTKFLRIVSLLSIVAIATLSSCEDKSTTTYRYNITNGVIGDFNAVVTSQYVLDLLTQRELNVTASESSEGRQQVDYTSFFSHTSASFRHKLFNMYVNYTLGMKVEAQSIASRIESPENASEPEADAWMTGMAKQRFVNCQPYAGIGLHYQKQDFRAEGEIALHAINWGLKQQTQPHNGRHNSAPKPTCHWDTI